MSTDVDLADQSGAGQPADGPAALGRPVPAGPDDFVDDDSWAQPRAQAGNGWRVLAGFLALSILGLGFFAVGVRYQKGRPASSTGGGFGRNFPGGAAAFSGFGGATGGGSGSGSGAGGSASQLSQIFDQLSGGSGAPAASEVRGTVTKVDGSTVTITKADGSTVTVDLSDSTQIGRRTKAATSDLTEGSTILVTGATGQDGTVSADQVTLGDLPAETTTTVAPGETTTAPGLGGLLPG